MEFSWVIPTASAAGQLLDHKDDINSLWRTFRNYLLASKKVIAITGMPGVGKTVLHDHLSGKGFNKNWRPPLPSKSLEKAKVDSRKRIHVAVIPGQDANYRHDATDIVFGGRKHVDGIIHVVANGFAEVRETGAKNKLLKSGYDTIAKYRAYHRENELVDLKKTCELIKPLIRKYRKPKWMLVAVAKVDLYHQSLEVNEAESYYSPHGSGQFVDTLNKFQDEVGRDNFRWEAEIVCSYPQNFNWNSETRSTGLDIVQRNNRLVAVCKINKLSENSRVPRRYLEHHHINLDYVYVDDQIKNDNALIH